MKILAVCGDNSFGQLGLNNNNNTNPSSSSTNREEDETIFLGINKMTNNENIEITTTEITNIALGGYHSLITTSNGKLFACGASGYGQTGSSISSKEFKEINYDTNSSNQNSDQQNINQNKRKILKISSGQEHTIFLTNDFKLFASGNNRFGQLGLRNDVVHVHSFREIENFDLEFNNLNNLINNSMNYNIKELICEYHNSAIITKDGKLYVCGNNKYYQLGKDFPVKFDKFTLMNWLNNNNTNTDNLYNNNIYNNDYNENIKFEKISFGYGHCLLLVSNKEEEKEVYVCGDNLFGELGITKNKRFISHFTKIDPTILNNEKVKDIKCGSKQSYILTKNGNLFVSGDNSFGELGLGSLVEKQFSFCKVNIPSSMPIIEMKCGCSHIFIKTLDACWFGTGLILSGAFKELAEYEFPTFNEEEQEEEAQIIVDNNNVENNVTSNVINNNSQEQKEQEEGKKSYCSEFVKLNFDKLAALQSKRMVGFDYKVVNDVYCGAFFTMFVYNEEKVLDKAISYFRQNLKKQIIIIIAEDNDDNNYSQLSDISIQIY